MRFMMIIKSNAMAEAGVLPTEQDFAAMGAYNAELIKAGVMLDGQGLQASSKGARVHFKGGSKPSVVEGPFGETKDLIAGYWIIQVKSREEAIEWAKRVPFNPEQCGGEGTIELRQVFEASDFGPAVESHDSITREALKQRS